MSHMNFCKLAASLLTLVAAFQVTVQAGTRPISTIPTVSQLAELKGSDGYISQQSGIFSRRQRNDSRSGRTRRQRWPG
jgi:hypothetical protein